MRYSILIPATLVALAACATSHTPAASPSRDASGFRAEVESYLESYDSTFKRLNYANQLAQWASNTHIVAGDSTNAVRARETGLALSRFVGSIENIEPPTRRRRFPTWCASGSWPRMRSWSSCMAFSSR